ncbi:hypothetical protein Mterra_03522 [Calidithermus terrae]|uniref:Uncharacterized protein n=1 Tax=Calidithermus terrae TaxID=1408545 RepID=A0A399E8Y3_9DEIN|nr:hypothetical protein [Calidithermus terrae]RIH80296.1 hypothetical protein Mterra_03522 [Calidithermus terrae]
MAWIAVFGLVVAVFVVVYLARRNALEAPVPAPAPLPFQPTASVIVDMDDEPPAEIDFDSGIEAGRKALEAQKPAKKDP